MKKVSAVLALMVLAALALSGASFAAVGDMVRTAEPFTGTVIADGFESPFDLHWGPDDMIWITERMGKRILRVDPKTGEKKVVATIDEAHAAGGHEGVLGMVHGPDFVKNGSEGHIYVIYTYKSDPSLQISDHKKIVRYLYSKENGTISNPHVILDGIPAGDDHQGGRLAVGPDEMLYLSLGELGHNQGANLTKPNEAQRLPTEAELRSRDYSSYVGKILRMDFDGAIPEDNPVLNGVRSHVFTYGHRNPQGLVFVGDNLFSCEHGPSVDDEVNLLEAGGNYGWPHVAGYRDDQAYHFVDWSKASQEAIDAYDANKPDTFPAAANPQRETDWSAPNFKEPVKTFHTVPNSYNFQDERFTGGMEYIYWPTVAPSSLAYYPADGPIPGWGNSILMTTLKTGSLYRLPLNMDRKSLQGVEYPYFRSQNRYRAVCVAPDLRSIYVITDSGGNARGMDGGPTKEMMNPGALIVFRYDPEARRQDMQ